MSMASEIAGTVEEYEMDLNTRFKAGKEGLVTNSVVASNDISLNQRMLSACVGSVLTSLVVTPFDVVRIRQQQQYLITPPAVTNAGECCRKVFWLDTVKEEARNVAINEFCVSHSCSQDVKFESTSEGLSKIIRNEGFASLYRGLSFTLLMGVPANIVYFSGYEYLRDRSPFRTSSPTLNPLICGSVARVLAATCVAPLELLKTRLQSIPSSLKNNPTHINANRKLFWKVLKRSGEEMSSRGLRSLFTGLQLTLWRDVPFSGIYWASYEFFSKRANFWNLPSLNDDDALRQHKGLDLGVFARSFLSGSISGVIAAVITNPFDVGKTRLQISEESVSSLNVRKSEKSMFQFLYSIVKAEGVRALYVGLFPRCLKVAPSCAIMISTYEMSKTLFLNQKL
ncbi:hypothetical protein LJB42_003780 [Komagataella kurtzmanii]|nr:hypothetical protein LJB42_003780 [Komagataella kurtzmanii]